ncbi:hypothetical protein DFR29_107318 [Tahibacter aquaticus]|uniref:Uncharacterized protein n=1 Tax=Tahibacter aquaticus TaxID=520092 RepID=A0A4R6YWU1_9GAMM|nr:hypothetical protein [Tahibacter aquaticus]TDR43304.1 hypothetical protein DFR29_107318 [Tahibacter aquaticus]
MKRELLHCLVAFALTLLASASGHAQAVIDAPLPLETQPFGNLTLVEEINTATATPSFQSPAGASSVATVLGRSARIMSMSPDAKAFAYRIGTGRGLVAGRAYVLEVEYPDDVARTIYVANRGADLVRGLATGKAVGDARRQFTRSTLESLDYPQSQQWTSLRSLFVLHERFSTLKAERNAVCANRNLLPADGFDVVVFQNKQWDDPRGSGAAIGKIRLYEVSNAATLPAPINYPSAPLPRRHLFWREEMADEAVSSNNAVQRAFAQPIDWFQAKITLARFYGFNTLGKDLMEWGHNQGFDGGDAQWIWNAQPPLVDIWTQIVARAGAAGLSVLPYFEYGGSIGACSGANCGYRSLGAQRRTKKLWDGVYTTCGNTSYYTCVWWTEGYSADVTDPDTLIDLQHLIDRTVIAHRNVADFVGIWLRTRQTKLPISFSPATLARYNADVPAQPRTIAQLRNDEASRASYYDWWYGKRRSLLLNVRDYMRSGLGDAFAQVHFSAYPGEPPPPAYTTPAEANLTNLISDDVSWWNTYAASLSGNADPDVANWYRWQWGGFTPAQALTQRQHYNGVFKTFAIPSSGSERPEETHSAPPPDPLRYASTNGISMTLPFGTGLYTVGDVQLFSDFSNDAGQTLTHFYPLNEDNGAAFEDAACTTHYAVSPTEPFQGRVGYTAVAVDRAGPYVTLAEARALANGNPINIGYLESSSFSRGEPAYVRRFNRALLSLPALAAATRTGAASDAAVVVREIVTAQGNYYAVINTALAPKTAVTVQLGGSGVVQDLLAGTALASTQLRFDLYPGEVRTFRVGGDAIFANGFQ